MINIGTLFSGGLAAVEWAMKYEEFEHEVVFACEWDKYARKSYLAFHGDPTSCFYEDVSDMKGHKYLDTIDLMCWGSPCQDLSLAGKRKGFYGEKSSLFREGARIMSEVMPKAFIFENVKGLLSSNGGADYKEVEKTFRDLGYHMAMKVVNAKEQGTAQNRERVFVIGFLDVNAYHGFHFAESIPLTKCLRDYLEDEVTEKYYLKDEMVDKFISIGDDCLLTENSISKTLRCGGRGSLSSKHSFDMLKVPNKLGFIGQDTQSASVFNIFSACPSLISGTHGYAQGYIAQTKVATNIKDSVRKNFLRDYSKIVFSDKPIFYCDCDSGFQDNKVCLTESACLRANNSDLFTLDREFRIRRLTPRECFRLMGMRDEDIVLVNSDTQSYKIAGNGIEINTMRSLIVQLYRPVKSSFSLF